MAIKSIFAAVEAVKKDIENLSVEELKAELTAGDDVLLLDIREIQEQVDLGTIPGARHAPRGMLEFWADPGSPYYRDWFEEDRRTVLFCAAGRALGPCRGRPRGHGVQQRRPPRVGIRRLA